MPEYIYTMNNVRKAHGDKVVGSDQGKLRIVTAAAA